MEMSETETLGVRASRLTIRDDVREREIGRK